MTGQSESLAGTGEAMNNPSPERNKAIVLEAFETLFNKRDYAAARSEERRVGKEC